MYKMRISTILTACFLILSNYLVGQLTVQIIDEASSPPCLDQGTFILNDVGIINGKNSYSDGAFTPTTIQWSTVNTRWEVYRGSSLIAFHLTDTANDPPCLSAGGWQSGANCTLGQLSGPDCDNLACALTIIESTQSACIDNGAGDYFTLTMNASVVNGATDYQVVVGGAQLGGDTPYGTAITVGDGTNGPIGTFAADGSSTYVVTVRDAATQTCLQMYTSTAVASCGTGSTFVMGRETGTLNACSGIFLDSGDLIANYSDNEADTLTLCSDQQNHISFSFENFNTESGQDLLYIHDGTDINAPEITGSPFSNFGPVNSPGIVTSTGSCLTFRFTSSASNTSLGWKADILCTGSKIVTFSNLSWTGYSYSDNCPSNAQIGGTVYEDINNNGLQDANEPGIKSVSASVFDDSGQVGAAVVTDDIGEYTFSGLVDTAVYRVEFTIPDFLEAGSLGSSSGTTIQFVQSGKCDVNLGLVDPYNTCPNANPEWVIPCYVNGQAGHSSNVGNTALAKFLYNDSGNSPAASYVVEVESQTIGSTWGIAYNTNTNEVYMSAVLKRHSGIGPLGIGAIYEHRIGDAGNVAPLFYDFGANAGAIADDATRFPGSGDDFGEEGPCGQCDNVDSTTFNQIGKVGFGDMEITSDNKSLYIVNLFDRQVYQINVDNPVPGSATALSSQPWLASAPCTNGIARPWALKIRRGKLYVGVVCDANSSGCNNVLACADLSAVLYSYDLSTSAWAQEFSFPLTYFRKTLNNGSNYWVQWIDDFADMEPLVYNITDAQFGQPVFSDIEFDDDGSLIMGFGDRTGNQLGYNSPPPNRTFDDTGERTFIHGDVLRAYYNPTTESYELENDGMVGPLTGTNIRDSTGIGGKSFYWGDWWYGDANSSGVGALAMKPGSGEVMFPLADLIDPYTNGVVWLNNTNGSSNRRIEIYQGSFDNSGTFAKGSGVGDIELACSGAPIEIGNYVWWDLDQDGLMDPSEVGISDVTVELYLDPDENTEGNNAANGDEILVATTTTDSYGRYIFSDTLNSNGLSPEVWETGHSKVLADTVYQVRILNYALDSALLDFRNTYGFSSHFITATMNQGATGTKRDNNAFDDSNHAAASTRTGFAGSNDHSIDFGFAGMQSCNLPTVAPYANTPCVGDTLALCANASQTTPPYTYSWAGPNSFNSTLEKPTIPVSTQYLNKNRIN